MKTMNYINLPESETKNIIDSLQLLLADLQIYYTNLRSFHWNIHGKKFFKLHDKFEEMYDVVADQIDEVAERILMLGGVPENKFTNYLKVARIKEVGSLGDSKETVKNTLDTLGHLITEERKIFVAAGEIDDEVTASMMSDYLNEQEKLVWMFTAYLS